VNLTLTGAEQGSQTGGLPCPPPSMYLNMCASLCAYLWEPCHRSDCDCKQQAGGAGKQKRHCCRL